MRPVPEPAVLPSVCPACKTKAPSFCPRLGKNFGTSQRPLRPPDGCICAVQRSGRTAKLPQHECVLRLAQRWGGSTSWPGGRLHCSTPAEKLLRAQPALTLRLLLPVRDNPTHPQERATLSLVRAGMVERAEPQASKCRHREISGTIAREQGAEYRTGKIARLEGDEAGDQSDHLEGSEAPTCRARQTDIATAAVHAGKGLLLCLTSRQTECAVTRRVAEGVRSCSLSMKPISRVDLERDGVAQRRLVREANDRWHSSTDLFACHASQHIDL